MKQPLASPRISSIVATAPDTALSPSLVQRVTDFSVSPSRPTSTMIKESFQSQLYQPQLKERNSLMPTKSSMSLGRNVKTGIHGAPFCDLTQISYYDRGKNAESVITWKSGAKVHSGYEHPGRGDSTYEAFRPHLLPNHHNYTDKDSRKHVETFASNTPIRVALNRDKKDFSSLPAAFNYSSYSQKKFDNRKEFENVKPGDTKSHVSLRFSSSFENDIDDVEQFVTPVSNFDYSSSQDDENLVEVKTLTSSSSPPPQMSGFASYYADNPGCKSDNRNQIFTTSKLNKLAFLRRRTPPPSLLAHPVEIREAKPSGNYISTPEAVPCFNLPAHSYTSRRSQSVMPPRKDWPIFYDNERKNLSRAAYYDRAVTPTAIIDEKSPYDHHRRNRNYVQSKKNYSPAMTKMHQREELPLSQVHVRDNQMKPERIYTFVNPRNATGATHASERKKDYKDDPTLLLNNYSGKIVDRSFNGNAHLPLNLYTNRKPSEDRVLNYVSTENLKDFNFRLTPKFLQLLSSQLKFTFSADWTNQVTTLIDLRRVACFHPAVLFNSGNSQSKIGANQINLRSIVTDVVKLLNSPRSLVSKHAAMCLIDLFAFGGKYMDTVVDEVTTTCLKKGSQTSSDFLSDAACCVLVQMCKSVSGTKILSSILNATASSRHQGYKTVGIKCLVVIIARLKLHILRMKEFPQLVQILLNACYEASSDIRNVSRIALSLLYKNIAGNVSVLSRNGLLSPMDIQKIEENVEKTTDQDIQFILNPFFDGNVSLFSQPSSTSSLPAVSHFNTSMKQSFSRTPQEMNTFTYQTSGN